LKKEKIGSDYSVDLEIKTDLRKSCVSDDLNDTVDYVLLNKIVVMDIQLSHLLEHVGHRIITRIFSEALRSRILLGVSKLNPPRW
jgi:dihydroneopterin aldolase